MKNIQVSFNIRLDIEKKKKKEKTGELETIQRKTQRKRLQKLTEHQ